MPLRKEQLRKAFLSTADSSALGIREVVWPMGVKEGKMWLHLAASPRSVTSQLHIAASPHSFTSQRHLTASPRSFTSQRHLTASPREFTLQLIPGKGIRD
ncbi:hypothetical protein POVWA2_056200 [Plasmodium ovale wallikeri]|uniref:Uncharacterized protein n=1 Tax=Plasmodium ovale wallikeri TaxID=864142 RepID=A0A1A8ZX25_PLAOA|nr:hypothetical protein POVWA1_056820 [Plasmodium ovale wallikeri]SBT48474.1 hypothetical protein POVWA2_056200 [Plasmodium ovale wallikeri]